MSELSNQYPVALKALDKDIYSAVLKQVIKDFHLTGLEPTWTENDAPDVFWSEFLEMIHQLLQNDPEKLRALLYRIDLEEVLLNELFTSYSSERLIEFSQQILIRVVQKVMHRKGYG